MVVNYGILFQQPYTYACVFPFSHTFSVVVDPSHLGITRYWAFSILGPVYAAFM